MDYIKALNKAKSLAYEAGSAIMDVYAKDFDVEYKEDHSPLTIADSRANEIIVNGIKAVFDMPILAEESKDDKKRMQSQWCWIIDPLDGTREFVKRNDEFTVNIALVKDKKPVLGVVYVPVTKEIYFAYKGNGAYYSNGDSEVKIHVSDKTDNLILMQSRSHSSDKIKNILDMNPHISKSISAGSSLKGCLVARGNADLYIRFNPTKEWDTCAMQCIVEESGGIMKQIDHTELIYNRDNIINEKGFYILNRMQQIKGLTE